MKKRFSSSWLAGLICFLTGVQALPAQTIQVIQAANAPDSSYYDIARIDDNEFWVGGENGILRCIDTLGNISVIHLPIQGRDILRIVPSGQYVYVAADEGTIFRYNRVRDKWIHADFSDQGFGKMTFYDMVVTSDGTIVLAGGHNKIAQGQITIPRGFIARIDGELLNAPEIVWSHALMFPFSLEYDARYDEVLASAFTGINSQLFSSVDGATTFQRKGSLPGLVHHIALHEGELWYSGAKGIRYSKTGIIGRQGDKPMELPGEGCIWSLMMAGSNVYSFAYNGAIVGADGDLADYHFKVRAAQTSLYEAAAISASKAFVVGHGRTILLVEDIPAESGGGMTLRVGNQATAGSR